MNLAILRLCQDQWFAALSNPDQSVTAGREALDHWQRYPWYDTATDGVRRVEIPDKWDWSWLWDWLPNWGGGYRGGWLDIGLRWSAWAVIVLILALVVYLLVRAYRDRADGREGVSSAGGKEDDGRDADRIEALPFSLTHGRLDLLGEAKRLYRQADYGRAVLYLFSYELVQLDRQQIIRLTKGKTNRQYLREVGRRSPLRQLVEQTMVAFEDVFFGNHALDRGQFESCWTRVGEFQSLIGEGAS